MFAADPISLDVVVKSTKKRRFAKSVILLNPRLAVGMRDWVDRETMGDQFLGVMCVAYSLRPLPWCNGTVFKKFPGPWKLYIGKENVQEGLISARIEFRPAGDELDDLVSEVYRGRDVGGRGDGEKSAVEKLAGFALPWRASQSLSN